MEMLLTLVLGAIILAIGFALGDKYKLAPILGILIGTVVLGLGIILVPDAKSLFNISIGQDPAITEKIGEITSKIETIGENQRSLDQDVNNDVAELKSEIRSIDASVGALNTDLFSRLNTLASDFQVLNQSQDSLNSRLTSALATLNQASLDLTFLKDQVRANSSQIENLSDLPNSVNAQLENVKGQLIQVEGIFRQAVETRASLENANFMLKSLQEFQRKFLRSILADNSISPAAASTCPHDYVQINDVFGNRFSLLEPEFSVVKGIDANNDGRICILEMFRTYFGS